MRLPRLLLAALLSLSLSLSSVYADDKPNDVGVGLTYETVIVNVLGVSPHVAGQPAAIVVQLTWANGQRLAANTGTVITFVRLPRAEDDFARAIDPTVISTVDSYGNSLIGYWLPVETIRPSEDVVTVQIEIKVFAIKAEGWPAFAWGERDFTVAVGPPQ